MQPSLRAVLVDAVQWGSFRDFLALSIPGGFMMQLEGNSYDITTLLAGLLGAPLASPMHIDKATSREFEVLKLAFSSEHTWRRLQTSERSDLCHVSQICRHTRRERWEMSSALPADFLQLQV